MKHKNGWNGHSSEVHVLYASLTNILSKSYGLVSGDVTTLAGFWGHDIGQVLVPVFAELTGLFRHHFFLDWSFGKSGQENFPCSEVFLCKASH